MIFVHGYVLHDYGRHLVFTVFIFYAFLIAFEDRNEFESVDGVEKNLLLGGMGRILLQVGEAPIYRSTQIAALDLDFHDD